MGIFFNILWFILGVFCGMGLISILVASKESDKLEGLVDKQVKKS